MIIFLKNASRHAWKYRDQFEPKKYFLRSFNAEAKIWRAAKGKKQRRGFVSVLNKIHVDERKVTRRVERKIII